MIGLDTNILVRFLTQDDSVQSPHAAQMIERRLTPETPGFVSLVTIAELVWVLQSIYEFTTQEIADAMERMLQIDSLVIQNQREVFLATDVLRNGTGEFDDALIGALGRWAGCSHTFTFDRKAARLKEFRLA
jgi:predicted nucleic-acid-binding protein